MSKPLHYGANKTSSSRKHVRCAPSAAKVLEMSYPSVSKALSFTDEMGNDMSQSVAQDKALQAIPYVC